MFQFEIIDDNESDEPSGTILSQNPSKGKLERGGKITLTVARAGTKVKVPDVYGYEYTSAERMLKSESFEVNIVKENSDIKDPGTVIRTSPARGEMAEAGALITLYVATNEETEPVDVPDLLGKTVEEAEKLLEEAGLVLDADATEYRASAATKGTIIGYDKVGEQVLPGTAIAVYVSTGVLPQTAESTEKTTAAETTTEANRETTTQKTSEPSTTKKPTDPPSTTKSQEAPTTTKPTTTQPPVTEKPTEKPTTTKAPEPSSEKPTDPPTTKRETTFPSTPQVEE